MAVFLWNFLSLIKLDRSLNQSYRYKMLKFTSLFLFAFALIILPSLSKAQQSDLKATAEQRQEQVKELKKNLNDLQSVERKVSNRVQNSSDRNYLSLSFENDLIGGGTDENYTNGVRLTYFDVETKVPPVIDELADAIPTFDLNQTTSTVFTIGQNLYTPKDITVRQLQQDDRPYAAWLYGTVGLTTITKNHMDEVEFTAGVVGPQALGEQVQKAVHKNVPDSPTPQGWDNQLDFEPGLNVSWRRRWPVWATQNIGDFRFRLEPNMNVALGNIYTYAGTGATLTFAPFEDRIQDTPPRVQPAMAGTGFFDSPDNEFSWLLFAGLDGRAMGRNIFLDGNTFKDSHSVDKKIFVGDANVGAAITYDDYRLSYTLNYRTKEFDGQDDPSIFGSLTLTTRF